MQPGNASPVDRVLRRQGGGDQDDGLRWETGSKIGYFVHEPNLF